jgi:hypothetical protein
MYPMMKLVVMMAAMTVLATLVACASSSKATSAGPSAVPTPKGMLRHVVLFKFKDGTSPDKIAEIEKAFAALPSKIDTIRGFEWGTNNSPEGLDQGLTHAFLVTFADTKGRDVYLPHPAHKQFVDLLKPHLEKAVVVDYFAH